MIGRLDRDRDEIVPLWDVLFAQAKDIPKLRRRRMVLAKNTHEGLGAPAVIFPMTFILLCGQVVPFLLLFSSVPSVVRFMAATACSLAFLPRLVAAGRFRQPWLSVLLHPLGVIALVGIQWFGLFRHLSGRRPQWKGRSLGADT
ncbi:MAG: hypothetical protein M3480_07055 [Verrucomicrobiota bacterium]|nr:hypothetical protein [Chthoniobacterales bacterium]MDQ3414714.1 hypothetical protein [Verrucomicrobiota bacterium]